MTRNLRSHKRETTQEIKDENGVIHTTARSLRKVNYAESVDATEDGVNNQESDASPAAKAGPDGDANGHDTESGNGSRYNLRRKRRRQPNIDDDDESFHTDDESEGSDSDDDDITEEMEQYKRQDSDDRFDRRAEDDNLAGYNINNSDEDNEESQDRGKSVHDKDREIDSEQNKRPKGRRRGRKKVAVLPSDDSIARRLRDHDKNFVTPDLENNFDDNDSGHLDSRGSYERSVEEDGENDDSEDGPVSRHTRRKLRPSTLRQSSSNLQETPPRRNLRSSTRRQHYRDYRDEHLTLADEIRELQDDSPIREKRFLRERTKPVDYRIPPLYPIGGEDEANYINDSNIPGSQSVNHYSQAVGKSNTGLRAGLGHFPKTASSNNLAPIRRLFPTGGPFGGNDVTTIFGQNTNFYSQPGQLNRKLLDSDSSEDEIVPFGTEPKQKEKKRKNPKKKQEIADLDPLGIDMNINFDDIGGLDNYIDQLKEMVVLPLLYPELYQNFSIVPPRGVLFHGSPGTGKTLMARALAASCSSESKKITFFMRKGADILSKWVGEAERQLRLLFEEAKKQQPSIIFFDEIDGLAPVRSSKQEQIHASIVSTLLALMDGMDNRGQVIVIGATNRPDAVDPALRRPGRFDREFYFPLPDRTARAKILKIHTRKWEQQLSPEFIDNLATLTRGYGGADLRALCTEAALSCIQRTFPQIYKSEEKLVVDPKRLKVTTRDFMGALDKIVPSSARSVGTIAEPLPSSVSPLLDIQFRKIKTLLNSILVRSDGDSQRNASIIQQYLEYETESSDEADMSFVHNFHQQELIKRLNETRVCRPRLLVTGPVGNGQQYIGAAILDYLEHYNIQKLDLGNLVSETSRSMEAAVVQGFTEARKRQPSVIYIPNVDVWLRVVPPSVVATLVSLFNSLQSKERILLLCVTDTVSLGDNDSLHSTIPSLVSQLDLAEDDVFKLEKPSEEQRRAFFHTLRDAMVIKPPLFHARHKRTTPLPELPKAEVSSPRNVDEDGKPLTKEEVLKKRLKSFQYQDMKLKNMLKIKLSGLMDLFKSRYKRFRKPPIDDAFLVHLFEPQQVTDPAWQPAYVKDKDMILEVATGRKFYNMDLDIIEERLWNGYYSEPKQYLRDIEMIYVDANTIGDRERIIKASEMFANAQIGIEDISTPEFIEECKATHRRDLERRRLYMQDTMAAPATGPVADGNCTDSTVDILPSPEKQTSDKNFADTINDVGVAAGNQLQAQVQIAASDEITNLGQLESVSSLAPEIPVANDESKQHLAPATVEGGPNLAAPKAVQSDTKCIAADTQTATSMVSVNAEKEVEVDISAVEELIEDLALKTDKCTISELEQIYSKAVRIIWDGRTEWEKGETVEKLREFITDL